MWCNGAEGSSYPPLPSGRANKKVWYVGVEKTPFLCALGIQHNFMCGTYMMCHSFIFCFCTWIARYYYMIATL